MKIVNTTIEENYLIVWDEDDNILEIPIEEFENWVEYYDRTEWVYDTLGFNGHEQTSGRRTFEEYLEVMDLTHEVNEFLKWRKERFRGVISSFGEFESTDKDDWVKCKVSFNCGKTFTVISPTSKYSINPLVIGKDVELMRSGYPDVWMFSFIDIIKGEIDYFTGANMLEEYIFVEAVLKDGKTYYLGVLNKYIEEGLSRGNTIELGRRNRRMWSLIKVLN